MRGGRVLGVCCETEENRALKPTFSQGSSQAYFLPAQEPAAARAGQEAASEAWPAQTTAGPQTTRAG